MSNEIVVKIDSALPAERPLASVAERPVVRRGDLTLDEAYEKRLEQKDTRADLVESEATHDPREKELARLGESEAQAFCAELLSLVPKVGISQEAAWKYMLAGRHDAVIEAIQTAVNSHAGKLQDKSEAEALRATWGPVLKRLRGTLGVLDQVADQVKENAVARAKASLEKRFGSEYQAEAREQGKREGYTEQELSGVLDDRLVSLLVKAARYDRTNATAREVPKIPKAKDTQTRQEPAVEPLGHNTNPLHRRPKEPARARLRRTGQLDDALAVLRGRKAAR